MHSTPTEIRLVVRAGGDFDGGMARVQGFLTAMPFQPEDALTIFTDLPLGDVAMLVEALAMDNELPSAVMVEPLAAADLAPGDRPLPASPPSGPPPGADAFVARIQHMRFEPGDSVLLTVRQPVNEVVDHMRSLATMLFPPFVRVYLVEEGYAKVELQRLGVATADYFDSMH